ncbi:unnamed protein product [Boreogadus saida]
MIKTGPSVVRQEKEETGVFSTQRQSKCLSPSAPLIPRLQPLELDGTSPETTHLRSTFIYLQGLQRGAW